MTELIVLSVPKVAVTTLCLRLVLKIFFDIAAWTFFSTDLKRIV